MCVLAAIGAGPATRPATPQWGIFETALTGPADGNPFADVQLYATFSQGKQNITVHGFYDGDGAYRIRFMPQQQGTWTYITQSNRPQLNAKTGEFDCTAPAAGNHGPVQVSNTYHFAYADGKPFILLGTTCYSWTQMPDAIEDQTLATLAQSPFDKVRMCVLPGKAEPIFYPYAQNAGGKFDPSRFDVRYFQHLEKRIAQMADLGIEAELILFHPYEKGKMQWFDTLDNAADDKYLDYLTARLGAFHNVWWSLANEYGQVKHKTDADWDHFFQVVRADDPYNHLRSIHNAARYYDANLPWVTHASIQNGAAVAEFGRAVLYRELVRKPLVYDEVAYEGNIDARWGHLSGQEMTKRFWMGTIAGAYVGHGETFSTPEKTSWTSDGGKLLGQSIPRLTFLRKILEAAPPDGIEPIDEFYESHVGGKAGEYYLVYFGEEHPSEWTFSIPRDPPQKKALAAGMKFHVDVIDTWNMTITPVDKIFTTAASITSTFASVEDGKIPLPGTPYMALRIIRQR